MKVRSTCLLECRGRRNLGDFVRRKADHWLPMVHRVHCLEIWFGLPTAMIKMGEYATKSSDMSVTMLLASPNDTKCDVLEDVHEKSSQREQACLRWT